MALPFSGILIRSPTLVDLASTQVKLINLKPVKRIIVRFDPFHENVTETRRFLTILTYPKVVKTNPYCVLKTDVVCDRSEPTITFNLQSDEKVILKTANLSCLNILELYNKHITSLVPPDPLELEIKALVELLNERKKRRLKKAPKRKEGSKHRGEIINEEEILKELKNLSL
ncbi:39S ribosomal protein L53, mitochondrial [Pseudomyrmex gracilis]|uniref:39S ribosomal protein L53, mitochondrial n=1 Tax=Pseudomyrmex gracilis TaxID=219809 RepID=UPI00099596CB|nr:39S ribosomal protein L53, mitochondrial [Pseudomyrmex gracilis]XP_020279329.1 39S ribosomal protein L53, mitochondrial [Pseudomyrmex gracilis]